MKGFEFRKPQRIQNDSSASCLERKWQLSSLGLSFRYLRGKRRKLLRNALDHCRKFGASWALLLQNQMPNIVSVYRGVRHHFGKGSVLSHPKNLHRGCAYIHSWMDGRMAVHSFAQTRVFPKDCANWSPFFNSITSPGASAVLTPRLDSSSHFWTGFPSLEHTPFKCVLLTPQKVTWNSNLFFPLLKAFQQFPVARREKLLMA